MDIIYKKITEHHEKSAIESAVLYLFSKNFSPALYEAAYDKLMEEIAEEEQRSMHNVKFFQGGSLS